MTPRFDVVVVGAGNAAFCAALAARECGASVLMLERAPKEENGGNSRFTAGAIRFAYDGVDALRKVMPDLTEDEIRITDFGAYPTDRFFDDMFRVTRYRTDPALCELLVTRSYETMLWLRSKGVRFAPIYGRQAFKVDGRFKFWGGLTVEAWGGGPGLVDQETTIATRQGIEIRYGARALNLLSDFHRVTGVRIKQGGALHEISAGAIVLAAVDSNRTRNGARAISGRVGNSQKSAAHASTRATVCAWRWTSAPHPRAIGRAVMPWAGTTMRRNSAISASATNSRSTPIPSASCSTRVGDASSTRARIFATAPTPNTAASSSSSRISSLGRSSTARSRICCATSTASIA